MDDIEHQILTYDELPADERAEVDAYLDAHPEAAPLLAEGRALRSLLEEAARVGADVPDAETVAQYVAARHMAQRPLPADLAALGRRIETSFAEHPEVERQYSIMQDRLKALTASAESPRAQFERLTGRRLGGRRDESRSPSKSSDAPLESVRGAIPEPSRIQAPPATPAAETTKRDRSKGWRSSVTDRPSLSLLQRVSLPRLAFAATFVVVLVYGSLFLASEAGQPQTVRLADLDTVEKEFAGLRLRGPDGQLDPAADRYAEALETLHDARSSTLGLFPHYDADGLTETIRLLEQAAELEGPDSALGLEAWFLIGRVLLYDGEIDAARDAFRIVVERQGPSAPDAQRLLDSLPEPAPAPSQ